MKSKLIVFLLFASPFVGMAHQPAFQMVSLKKTGTAWQLVYSETMAQLEAARFEPNDFIPYLSILADGKPLALSVYNYTLPRSTMLNLSPSGSTRGQAMGNQHGFFDWKGQTDKWPERTEMMCMLRF